MREEIAIERQIVLRVCRGGCVFQIAHVLAQHCLAVLDQAKAVLELAAQGQDLRLAVKALWQCQGGRGVASSTPQQPRPPEIDPHHGVVDAVGDVSVVHQGEVGDLGETVPRLVVSGALRLAGDVAAGHHHRPRHAAQQHVVHRRVRQHETDVVEAGRHRLGQSLALRLEQNDGCLRAGQQGFLFRRHRAVAADDVQVPGHQREGLAAAALPGAQALHHVRLGRIAREMEASDAFDRHDVAHHQHATGRIHVVEHGEGFVVHRAAAEVLDPGARAAAVAGDGLGMEPTVGRILVLAPAGRTEREVPHGRVGAVVGRAFDDGEAWPAVGAVGEGIAIAIGEGIPHLGQALRTGRHVRRHRHAHLASCRSLDLETLGRRCIERCAVDQIDARQARRLGLQTLGEAVQRLTPKADLDALARVANVTGETKLVCDAPDGRAEADALNLAAHGDGFTPHGASSQSSTRLLPLSAMARMLPRLDRP